MTLLDISLLGGFRAQLASGAPLTLPTKKTNALLAFLAMPSGQAHPRGKLATLLWGDMQEPQARASLRQAIFAIRKALPGTDVLRQEGGNVALRSEAVRVDVAGFESLVAEGTRDSLERASALYGGPFLEGLVLREAPFEEWLIAQRLRLQELAVEALSRLEALQRAAGALEPAVQSGLRLLGIDPAQEAVHRTLMRHFVQLGRRGAALRQYQACVEVLARELRSEPGPETKALYQEILAARPIGAAPADEARRPGPAPPPGRDLRRHETPLIGRDLEMARIRHILEDAWGGEGLVVSISGEIGIGKSRLASEVLGEASRRGGLAVLGRCYETEQILPFGPWVEALRGVDAASVGAALGELRPAWRTELSRLLPEIASDRPGPDASPGALRLFEAVAQLLQRLASRQPLVALLEDMHWADEMSIRLLAFLGRRIQKAAVLLVITVRDEDVGEAPLLQQTLDELTREG